MKGEFTGRHMAATMIGFFGLVIGVNVTMATFASSTFGGTVVDNSYVASQKFNGWLEEAREQAAIGWDMVPARRADGRLTVRMTDAAGVLSGARVDAVARHPLGRAPDMPIAFHEVEPGHYVSNGALPDGRWQIHITASAQGATVKRIILLEAARL